MNDIQNFAETKDHSQGFAEASWLLASDVDSESFIFRRFNRLSARNILYLQCELLALEERLEKFDRVVDRNIDTSLQEFARKWERLLAQSNEGEPRAVNMIAAVRELRVKLREYHETLKLQSERVAMHPPERRALEATRNWLEQPLPVLGGRSRHFLEDETDLVSLKVPAEADFLSKRLRACWPGQVMGSPASHRVLF
ncbi:uncharacterized protein BDZ83DRAFT_11248 [Colletotrichum acutatum]|uniref:DUF6594 domain-containing protein n=1 Tax=Glomerella acutata TaxID=27357 RepID=A0AAD8XQW9_GLOAC|nr:uncharacterized protein BDZ83DRAFT_11248 [Colletotrichum acutatum]KAK1731968.1 hypothetical protein BDZ83DRAFT_11248 [Colletotrichum acutatum]